MATMCDTLPYAVEVRHLWRVEKEVRRYMAAGLIPPDEVLEEATLIREMSDRPSLARRAGALLAEVFVHQQVAS